MNTREVDKYGALSTVELETDDAADHLKETNGQPSALLSRSAACVMMLKSTVG